MTRGVSAIIPVPLPTMAKNLVRVAVSTRCSFPVIIDPTDAEVAFWHAQYVTELRNLHAEFRTTDDTPLCVFE
jgi:hypothetical protein